MPKAAKEKAPKEPKEKKEKKAKKAKDPNAPKRGQSAYQFFCSEKRAGVKESLPNATGADIMKELGKLWSETSEEDKKKYQVLSEKDKARATEQIKAYKEGKTTAKDKDKSDEDADADEDDGDSS